MREAWRPGTMGTLRLVPRIPSSPPVGSAHAVPTVPVESARRLLLAGCLLDRTPVKATRATVLATVERLGFVQVDSINTVERAHHLILHARHEGYRPAHLAHHTEGSRRLFEHWTHDASVIRADWRPYWAHRFEKSRARVASSAWMRERLGPRWRSTMRELLALIEADGPLSTSEVHERRPQRARTGGGWWSWSPEKAALELLWRSGELAITARRGFEKVYDLSERVHGPSPAAPTHDALVEWACREALARLGAATPREVAQFMQAITPVDAARWCRRAALEGEIEAVRLERLGRPAVAGFARADWSRAAARVRIDGSPRLLAPFDPLIRDRDRLAGLFGFEYRFEAFVPAAKRRHGYYTMPVLAGERLVARLDLASERRSGALVVARAWREGGIGSGDAMREARRAAGRLAMQLGLDLRFPMGRIGAAV